VKVAQKGHGQDTSERVGERHGGQKEQEQKERQKEMAIKMGERV